MYLYSVNVCRYLMFRTEEEIFGVLSVKSECPHLPWAVVIHLQDTSVTQPVNVGLLG